MNAFTVVIIIGYFSSGESYTKYGRSCKDIGCPSNQICVMETDPCSYYQRQGECGSYPTCKRNTNSAGRNCATYVCPPTKICKMDGDTPKCVDDHSQVGHAGYDTQSQNVVGHQQSGGSQLYPSIPKGETTPRPNIYHQSMGGGYQGGQIGSGYPGQQNSNNRGGYPQQTGYPHQGGYPQQGYPQAYPSQGGYQQYPGYQQGGYQQGGYQQGGYQQGGYPQGGYQQGYGRPSSGSSGNSFSDQITNSLKSIGTDLLKNALSKALSGKN